MKSSTLQSIHFSRFSLGRAIILSLVVYSIVIWYYMERCTDSGALLNSWRQEYAGGGSMAFRTLEGHAFVRLAIPYGLLVYPATVIAAFALLGGVMQRGPAWYRCSRIALAVIMVAILWRFLILDVAGCALGRL